MAKFSVTVEVIRAYFIEVEADSAEAAISKVGDMSVVDIEDKGEYLDTHTVIDDEPERFN